MQQPRQEKHPEELEVKFHLPGGKSIMDHDALMDADEKRDSKALTKAYSKFQVRGGNFFEFHKKELNAEALDAMNRNWKAHISIHPDQLGEAWHLINPLLFDRAIYFKIVNTDRLAASTKETLEKIDQVGNTIEEVLRTLHSLAFNTKLTQENVQPILQRIRPLHLREALMNWEEALGKSKEDLYRHIIQGRDSYIAEVRKVLTENQRLTFGMQITMYIPTGTEVKQWILLEEIDALLCQHKIRSGCIDDSDKALSSFISIRHPGLTYQSGAEVKSYNPDNVPDPFQPAALHRAKKEAEALQRLQASVAAAAAQYRLVHAISSESDQNRRRFGIGIDSEKEKLRQETLGLSTMLVSFHDLQEAQRYLVDYLKDPKTGATKPQSFKTMLLHHLCSGQVEFVEDPAALKRVSEHYDHFMDTMKRRFIDEATEALLVSSTRPSIGGVNVVRSFVLTNIALYMGFLSLKIQEIRDLCGLV